MKNYPHTISNGAGEELTFVGVVHLADGDRVDAEMRAKPGAGPPMHVHRLQEEAMTVRSGKVGYQILGQEPRYAEPGATVIFPPGVAHRWWNAGTTDLHCTGWAKPPDNVEFFLTSIYDSIRQNGRKRPNLFDAAFLLTRYKSEFAMLEIPAVVQKFLFPLMIVVGRWLGKYDKFRNAPEPIVARG